MIKYTAVFCSLLVLGLSAQDELHQPASEVQPVSEALPPPPQDNHIVSSAGKSGSALSQPETPFLPWTVATLMAALAGAAGSYILVLRKQGKHFKALRQQVINGSQPVHLLTDEATRLLRDFVQNSNAALKELGDCIRRHRQDMERIVDEAENSSRTSREETSQTVKTFKESLNGMLGGLNKFMERVVQDTGKSHSQALETKEYAKSVAELLQAKESEIAKLKEGYHLHLITPLTKAFLKIRDDLHLMTAHAPDDQIKGQLSDLDQKIEAALSDLQIVEIQIPENPREKLPPQYWVSLGAAEKTADPAQHGKLARTQEKGYQLRTPNGEPHIIRKAVLVIYGYSPPQLDGERIASGIESGSANMALSTTPQDHSPDHSPN